MIRNYTFGDVGTVAFDDSKSVRELIAYAFEVFGCCEPLGMDIVTVFQRSHPDTYSGWFTTDVNLLCGQEIKSPGELHFAYHMPGVFYYAEGGWGKHMKDLGNHPEIPEAVSLGLRVGEEKHTVVIAGKYRFADIIRKLKETGYIDEDCAELKVIPVGCAHKAYRIPFTDPIVQVRLTEFEKLLEAYTDERVQPDPDECVYHTILEFC